MIPIRFFGPGELFHKGFRAAQYLGKNDCLKLDIEELELLTGPEASEVNLRYILMNASRRGSMIFEILQHEREK